MKLKQQSINYDLKKPEAVIFDLDGTLVDTEKIGLNCFLLVGERMKIPFTRSLYHKIIGLDSQHAFAVIEKELKQPFSVSEFKKYFRGYYIDNIKKEGIPLKKGAIKILDFLKKKSIPVAIATSSSDFNAADKLKSTGIIDRFDVVITADQVERKKPDPQVYLKVCENLGFLPKNCLAIEDSDPGALSAHLAGIPVFLVPDIKYPSDKTNSFILGVMHSLNEIRNILEKIC